jgi:hypothetical protein
MEYVCVCVCPSWLFSSLDEQICNMEQYMEFAKYIGFHCNEASVYLTGVLDIKCSFSN